jgi:hypothetical protein
VLRESTQSLPAVSKVSPQEGGMDPPHYLQSSRILLEGEHQIFREKWFWKRCDVLLRQKIGIYNEFMIPLPWASNKSDVFPSRTQKGFKKGILGFGFILVFCFVFDKVKHFSLTYACHVSNLSPNSIKI